jgi:transposase
MVEKTDSEAVVREIKRRTRKKYSSEEKIRIVLEGLRGVESVAELCRKEGIQPNVYYKWSKDFLEAGKKRLQEIASGRRPRVRWWISGRRTIS